jgi:hypothetical protein
MVKNNILTAAATTTRRSAFIIKKIDLKQQMPI